jgi:hypothetical protein
MSMKAAKKFNLSKSPPASTNAHLLSYIMQELSKTAPRPHSGGTGAAKSLSSGISEALVTTESGLLARMARQKIGNLEQTAVGFIHGGVASKHEDK